MHKDYIQINSKNNPEVPSGLFDKIILAIKREKELRQGRRLLFIFAGLLFVSLGAIPFSWALLANEWEASGVFYFISVATSNLGIFAAFWQDFSISILESLPVVGILVFTINIALLLFAIRLFLYKKNLLFKYLINNLAF